MIDDSPPTDPRPNKCCFVTIGATASFNPLIATCLSPAFLQALQQNGYTDLRLQFGKEGREVFDKFILAHPHEAEERCGLAITGVEFCREGLGQEMRAAKGDRLGEGEGVEGVVISHAGSGSILDALRLGVTTIVVPNPSLLDNHQVELAEELASQGYVIHGKLDDLPAALTQAEKFREAQKAWPPVNSGEDPSGRGLMGVMDDEMGFVD